VAKIVFSRLCVAKEVPPSLFSEESAPFLQENAAPDTIKESITINIIFTFENRSINFSQQDIFPIISRKTTLYNASKN
jgi:hypothetical protein